MMLDLKKLNDESYDVREFGNPASDVDILQIRSLLAIAERIEALVEAQKPTLVELETVSGNLCYINPQFISDVCIINANYTNAGMVLVSTSTDSQITVKGTLAEVVAKLRTR